MNQAGSGISGFQGIRYQRGNGFMGRMISGTVMPILKKILPFLGRTALNAGSNIMQDIENGENIGESAKKRFKETKDIIKMKAADKIKQLTGGSKRQHQNNKATGKNKRTKPGKKTKRLKKTRASKKCKSSKKHRNKVATDFL